MQLVILGPQGSGKGTQGELLMKKFGLASFAMGDALREKAKEGSKEGRLVNDILLEGSMVPNHITDGFVKDFLDNNHDWILDGYPRNMEQAGFFDQNATPDAVIVLELTDEAAVERLANRRVCSQGHIYHTTNKPPKQSGICDVDGLPLHQRDDDTPEAIRERLKLYREKTQVVVDHYKEKVIVVEASGTIDDVNAAVMEKIKGLA